RERAEFEDAADALASTDNRRKRNRVAFWDLLAAEREFSASRLLPSEIFVEWFGLLHAELHSESKLAGASYEQSWNDDGVRFAGVIFPRFAELMVLALAEKDFKRLRPAVARSLRSRRSTALF